MGLNFRKSINLGGGFKINLSKSGVGYSFNVPGGRVSRTASGKIRFNYTGVKSRGKSSTKDKDESVKSSDIENADIGNFQSIEYRVIIDKIAKLLWINRIGNVFILLALLVFINPYFLISLGVGFALKILIRTALRVNFEYNFDDEFKENHDEKVQAWIKLNECNKLWQVVSESRVINKKAIAGIDRNVIRKPIKIIKKTPYFLSINVEVVQLKLNKETLILLPDKLLIVRGCKVGAINYNNFTIEISSTEFVESNKAPKDAKIIDYRWQYSNKNGEPDKRYKKNRKIPIFLYGVIYLKSEEGLNVEIQYSNIEITDKIIQNINIS